MPPLFLQLLLLLSFIFPIISSQCISSGDQTTINTALSAGGTDTIVQLCPNALINLTDTVYFTAPNQEISTVGYPTDSTRATLQLVPGTDTSTLISGVGFSGLRILNIQIDGNRDVTGYLKGGGASIELGGAGTGQRIEYTASRNPRTWSCMHIVESADSGNPCTNATLVNNDIGPCGVEGTEASTNGMWADGISFACTNSLVGSNTITSATDGFIVIYGATNSIITNNTLTSSATNSAFGAINLVDQTYDGYYGGVTISNNRITGTKFFNLGIAIGEYIWSFNDPYVLRGPVTIVNNTISGNVAFPIAVNGWADGLTISGTDTSLVTSPRSSFASANGCSGVVRGLFEANDALVYYPPGVAGEVNLQPEFVAADSSIGNFLCTGWKESEVKAERRMERRWRSQMIKGIE